MAGEQLTLGGWACAATPAGTTTDPAALDAADAAWIPAVVPGTAAAALQAAGLAVEGRDLDAEDWWFRTTFDRPAGSGWQVTFAGLASIADVWLNGTPILHSANMFRRSVVALDDALLRDANELTIRCAALTPLLATKRRPRPRWKARLPTDQGLRWFRTTLIGRSPSWTPPIAPVGPWRPVALERPAPVTMSEPRIRAHHDGTDGLVDLRVRLHPSGPGPLSAMLVVGSQRAALDSQADGDTVVVTGRTAVPGARPWWPATHGDQPLTPAHLEVTVGDDTTVIDLGRFGFRTVELDRGDAPVLRVNGEPVFCRGACWAPLDIVTLGTDPAALRRALEQVRDAGLNLLRIQGSFVPETDDFHDLCDELGILVWHDLMFATLDYPADDADFVAEVHAEVGELLDRLQRHASTAVICGNSEVQQQAAMLGRTAEGPDLLFDKLLPDLVADHLPDVPYWPGSPTWSGAAFGVDTGVAHYFGVGGYLRPLTDARTSGVKFASECLAFSCVPGDDTVAELRSRDIVVGNGPWKAGVPRDAGRAWDFEDVRDHYVRDRFGIDPASVRAVDPDHYLDLGRAAVAEVMAAALTEWRRGGSPCQGAVILQERDLVPGAGFGLVDVSGRPKSVWHALRRVLQPVALLCTDEGVNGLDLHVVNDLATPLSGTLRVIAWSGAHSVADGEVPLAVDPRSTHTVRADAVLGGFYDLTWSYRFGPRSIDAVAATWRPDGADPVHAVFLPGGAPLERGDTGLAATVRTVEEGVQELHVTTDRVARCVLVEAPGATLSDDAFDLEPGRDAVVMVRGARSSTIGVRCVNGRHGVSAGVLA